MNVALHSLSLCSGYEGLGLALDIACPGVFQPVLYSEREISVAEILAARIEEGAIPSACVWSDIKTICDAEVRDYVRERTGGAGIGMLTAGYPCQPFSCAGKRRGKDDPRHLWPWIVDAIDCYRPALCFFENVPGHLILGYREVRRTLEERGYRVKEGLFSAEEVGAPHRRLRLFILAVAESGRCEAVCEHDGQPLGDGSEMARRGFIDGRDAKVVHPRRNGRRSGNEGLQTGELGRRGFENCCREMGVAIPERSERLNTGRPEARPVDGTCGSDVPVWPPARNDIFGWQRTLADCPWLAPAVTQEEAKLAIRDLADESAQGLGRRESPSWNEKLRALGNGVVPLTAAIAFVQLLAAHFASVESQ